MKRLLPLFLALALALTTQAMAVAKGQAGAVGAMVICAGGVSVTVQVDADGNPTGPGHICPECALAMLDGSPASAAKALPDTLAAAAPHWRTAPAVAAVPMAAPSARAPPLSV